MFIKLSRQIRMSTLVFEKRSDCGSHLLPKCVGERHVGEGISAIFEKKPRACFKNRFGLTSGTYV